MMRKLALSLSAIVLPLVLGACGNGGASEPPVTEIFPAGSTKMQFAVGIATIASNGGQSVAYGLNTVVTLRQNNGLSGTLYNQPQIIGPSSFNVLNSTQTGNEVQFAGGDLGTNHITWATLNQEYWTGPPRSLKAATTGAFGYGFCPCNSDAGPVNGVQSLYQSFNLPVYGGSGNLQRFYGGPPAFPAVDPSVAALGFQGYSLGFTDFAVTPVVGTYHLYAAIPPAFTTPGNPTPSPQPDSTPTPAPGVLSANAQITTTAALPVMSTPAFTGDGKGGGHVAFTVPAGVRETAVFVIAVHGSGTGACVQAHVNDAFYTLVSHGTGKQSLALPDMLGPLTQSGQPTATICPQGQYQVYAAGTDYPMFEAAYPQNLSELPRITAPNGQADITTSDTLQGTYP